MGWIRNLVNASKPDWERAWLACRAFGGEGDWQRAVLWGRIAAEQNPKSADVWNDFGFSLNALAHAQYVAAVAKSSFPSPPREDSTPVGELAPLGDSGIRAVLAIQRDKAKAVAQWEEAVGVLAHALALKPRFAEAHNNHGVALLRCGRLEESREAFTKALHFKPGYANAQANLAYLEVEIANRPTSD
ncbi:MAG: hypothetical protein ABI782_00675 [Anaerolineaceae bacterium]